MTAAPLPRLPGLFHVGWVVRDCAAAQAELRARLGAGPFVSAGEESRFDQALVHGKPTPFALKIAFGALGGVLLELLQPLDDRSPHAEFLAACGEGLHHLAFLVPDFDEQLAAVRAAHPGADLLIDGTGPGNPVRWVYLDAGMARGTVIELLERTPQSEALFGSALGLLGAGTLGSGARRLTPRQPGTGCPPVLICYHAR
jgi:methylmalonyl-CoA/ethylmalonyl-CoA epimerase